MVNKVIYLLVLFLFASCQQTNNDNVKTDVSNNSFSIESKTATIITTAKDTDLRLTETGKKKFSKSAQPLETENSIFVNPNHTFQTFIGIGGAITDASAEVFAKLSADKQKELLSAYYGKEGINYTLMRTSIHSCDFSSSSFTYIKEGDKELKTFSIEHDRQYRLPMIKRAIAEAGGDMLFYMSPWSPPAFMKDNNSMIFGGKLLPEYMQSWANYYVKFIEEYRKEDINIWGITVQNEKQFST